MMHDNRTTTMVVVPQAYVDRVERKIGAVAKADAKRKRKAQRNARKVNR